MGIKDALKKLKPQEQSCCSVEIEENTGDKEEKNEVKEKENNKCC
ncbi:alcohol dehydrogenase [Staphylococcus succinus]|nr:alcohol dehydrogenase [Staphylococcus succinus]PKI20693.1 alcohol dehydrogenase [Staphylococcus succinus]